MKRNIIGTIGKTIAVIVSAAALLSTGACGSANASDDADTKNVIVGVSPIYAELANTIKNQFDKQNKAEGKTLTVKVFDDFVTPNMAVEEGSININFFQHGVYLKEYNKKHGNKLKAYDPNGLFRYYMGIYSKDLTSLKQLKDGDTVLIPNDASNRGRALKTLAANGLLELKDGVAIPGILDIESNPKNLKLTETDTLKEVKSLGDAQAAVVNAISMAQGGYEPTKNLGVEDKAESAKYSLVVAYKDGSGNDKNAKLFTKAVETDAVKKEMAKEFKGAVVPLW